MISKALLGLSVPDKQPSMTVHYNPNPNPSHMTTQVQALPDNGIQPVVTSLPPLAIGLSPLYPAPYTQVRALLEAHPRGMLASLLHSDYQKRFARAFPSCKAQLGLGLGLDLASGLVYGYLHGIY